MTDTQISQDPGSLKQNIKDPGTSPLGQGPGSSVFGSSGSDSENNIDEHKKLAWRFVWGGLLLGLTQEERESAERQAREYGSRAGEQRLLGLMRRKFGRDDLLKLVSEAYRKARLVIGSRQATPVGGQEVDRSQKSDDASPLVTGSGSTEGLQPPPNLPLGQVEEKDGMNDFGKKMAEVGKPLLSVYVLIEFVQGVMGEYLSAVEMEEWQEKLGSEDLTEEMMLELVALLEERSGRGIDSLVREAGERGAESLSSDLVDSVEELALIHKAGKESRLAKALENGDVVALASLYKKVSEGE